MKNESEYIKELSRGSEIAFEWLFLKYQPKVVFFISGFLHNEEAARDMTQDIFFTLWTNRTALSTIDSFSSYIYKMAKNAIYNYFDHSMVKEKYQTFVLANSIASEDEEEIIIANEVKEMIEFAVERMPERQRRIFIMSREEGMNNQEIAIHLNISKRTVENHLTLALANIRRILGGMKIFF